MVRDKPVDIIISDFGSGEPNGMEFARRLRRGEAGPHRAIPIIMLAAPEEQAQAHLASEIGINEFLCKPVSPSSLYSRMLAITSEPREFVDIETYTGPDRRETPREPDEGTVDSQAEDGQGDGDEIIETPISAAPPSPPPSKVFLQSAQS